MVFALGVVEAEISHKFFGGHSNRMTEMSEKIPDEVEACLVELGIDADNVSGDDDVPSPLESDVSSDESEDDDSSDIVEDGQGAGAKLKANSSSKLETVSERERDTMYIVGVRIHNLLQYIHGEEIII